MTADYSEKSIKRNYIYNALYQVLLILSPIITAPYLSRVLEPDGIGTQSFIGSIASYFVIFATMGVFTYGRREVAYVKNDIHKRSIVFWNTKILSFVISTVVLAIYLVMSCFQEQKIIYLVFSLNIISVFVDTTWFYQGLEEFGIITLVQSLVRIAEVLFVFVFVKTKDDLVIHILGTMLIPLLGHIVTWIILPGYIERVKTNELFPFRDFKAVLVLFIPTIAIQLYAYIDKTMIGIITKNAFENGYYEQASKIARMAVCLITGASTAIMPRLSYLWKNNQIEEIPELMGKAYRVMWFLGLPMMVGLICIAPNLVPWFFGDDYIRVIPVLQILSLLFVPLGLRILLGEQYLIATGKEKVLTITICLGIAVNVGLNSFMIKNYNSIGAAVASVVAESVVAIVQIIAVRKQLSPGLIFKGSWKYLVSSLLMGIILVYLNSLLEPGIKESAIIIAVGILVYFVFLFLLRDKMLFNEIKHLLKGTK